MRTLPIRVNPIDGEALDSWLEALAHRTHTAFGDLLQAVGLATHPQTTAAWWMVGLSSTEIETVSAVTGVSSATLNRMTLHRYADDAVHLDRRLYVAERYLPWSTPTGSGFCPACLEETGGRWNLDWRLGWTFVCIKHHCLLAHACPECGGVQRGRAHIKETIPQLGRCSNPATSALGRSPKRCGADLSHARVSIFRIEHPVIKAQQTVNAIIATATPRFGLYNAHTQPRASVLADIRAVAGRVLAYATPRDLEAVIPADLLAVYRGPIRRPSSRRGPSRDPRQVVPTPAASAAVGVVAALNVLDHVSVAGAGEALRWLVQSSRDQGLSVTATNIGWGKGISAALVGAQLAALGPLLNPSDQLRYRIGTPMPTHPAPSDEHSTILAKRLPPMLWPAWSLRFSIPKCHQRQLRPALAVALLLVHSRLSLDDAARIVDCPISGQAVSRVLQLLEDHERWPDIRAGLIRMAERLATENVPIDYQLRRRLNYSQLLPDTTWAQICRDTGTPGAGTARAKIARSYLFEQLSGLPSAAAPWGADDSAFRSRVANFPQHLSPALSAALNGHAQEFLSDMDIFGEPPVWSPPSNVLDGLLLPGPNPDDLNVAELRNLVNAEQMTLGNAAKLIGTSLDTARHVLQVAAVASSSAVDADQAAPTSASAYCAARGALPRSRFVELYHDQRMSLRDIAVDVGVSRQTIARLAHDYEVSVRQPCRHTRNPVDRDWLYEQYVTGRRALPDLAREAGMSTSSMARWAKTHAIPLRGRGGQSHSASLAAQRDVPSALEHDSTLVGTRTWQRLQLFACAARYRTLTVAAQELGVRPISLINRIKYLESELGMQLLVRPENGCAMQLTDDGIQVLRSLRQTSD
ncbi:TniQ family protein [Mycolicibacterium mucogenicum]|uniref:LysR family transcriptional regulator n=1 Tax=Mycolicibacterium mucogenicum TaxID=56689 RepID=A0A4R5W726_MYCMU|nr:TniQ family protein [Mycolicibacterium mucogenicum]TDK84589.1 LysR family transcriptional regulator [Mycolicibacterium mucogenicum]